MGVADAHLALAGEYLRSVHYVDAVQVNPDFRRNRKEPPSVSDGNSAPANVHAPDYPLREHAIGRAMKKEGAVEMLFTTIRKSNAPFDMDFFNI